MTEFEGVIPTITRCNTCKAMFSNVELIREHYKTDWHVFNSKRRANNLIHVTLEEYRRQYPIQKKNNNNNNSNNNATTISSSSSPSGPNNNSKITKQSPTKKNTTTSTSTTVTTTTITTSKTETNNIDNEEIKDNNENNNEVNNEITESLKNLALELGVESERVNDIVTNALQQKLTGDEDDDDDEEEEEEEEPIIVEPNVSIFDDKEFPTVEECFNYMELKFGLFIPEREYLIDLPGLLVYLGEKVKIGGICLYCQKHMRPGRPLQNHMIDKSHCKLAYEEGIDLDEYEDFYDFSSSYQNGGNGDGDEDDENEETLEISPIGELILTDGRTVGHRAFRKYYRQKHKPIDNRLAIANQRREDILKFQTSNLRTNDIISLGLTSSSNVRNALNGMDLRRLSDNEIMLLIVKKHKELKKMQQIEQRAQKRHEYRHNRAEYLSTKDQLRARINRTDKIRDYHGMLM